MKPLKGSTNPKPISNTIDGRYEGNLPDPQNFGEFLNGIAYPEYPAIGDQSVANGGSKDSLPMGHSDDPRSAPGGDGGWLRKHGKG